MSITCDNCQYDRNPPTATRCEVCDASLIAGSQPQPSVSSTNLSHESPQSSLQTSTSDPSLPPRQQQYSDPLPTIDIQPLRQQQYSDPPPTIDIQPPRQQQYSDPPPTIDIQPPRQQQYSDPPPTIDIQPPRQQHSPTPTFSQTNSPAMTITCPQCGYDRNAPGTEFCDVCGYEFSPVPVESFPISEPTKLQEPLANTYLQTPPPVVQPPQTPPSISTTPVASASTAKLIAKQTDSPTAEFALEDSNVIGRFDPDLGPVEIDLEGFVGVDYISRNHAEIYQEAGQWKIKDLGSENGVFLKRLGQTRFSPRITNPEILNSGDEIAFGKIRFIFQSP